MDDSEAASALANLANVSSHHHHHLVTTAPPSSTSSGRVGDPESALLQEALNFIDQSSAAPPSLPHTLNPTVVGSNMNSAVHPQSLPTVSAGPIAHYQHQNVSENQLINDHCNLYNLLKKSPFYLVLTFLKRYLFFRS